MEKKKSDLARFSDFILGPSPKTPPIEKDCICGCDSGKPGHLCLDPYEAEINGIDVEVCLCEDCYASYSEQIQIKVKEAI